MQQISISFDKKTEDKLRKGAKKSGLSIAHYARRVVEIGLKFEEESEKNTKTGASKNDIKKLLTKDLSATVETLYLVRYLLTLMPESGGRKHQQMLEKAKVTAQAFVEGLVNGQEG